MLVWGAPIKRLRLMDLRQACLYHFSSPSVALGRNRLGGSYCGGEAARRPRPQLLALVRQTPIMISKFMIIS